MRVDHGYECIYISSGNSDVSASSGISIVGSIRSKQQGIRKNISNNIKRMLPTRKVNTPYPMTLHLVFGREFLKESVM